VNAAADFGTIRVLLADDDKRYAAALRVLIEEQPELTVVALAYDGVETIDLADELSPDAVVVDLHMPNMDGVTAIRQLAPAQRILVLTTFDADTDVLPAIEAGATGYLLKDAPRSELYRAVRAAARGEAVLSPPVATRVLRAARSDEPSLSAREIEILELVARGTTNREAAERLFISEATVKTHLIHIYAKLGVPDRASAVAAAYDRGLLQPRSR